MSFKCLILFLSSVHAVSSREFVLRPILGNQNEGYVEMEVNGTWGIMTSKYEQIDDTTSRMLCQHFGFGLRGFSTSSWTDLGLSNNVLLWDKLINCKGNESHVIDCVPDTWSNTEHSVTTLTKGWTRLHCFDFVVTDVRLYGGFVPHVGRLEVKVGSRWGSVNSYPDPTRSTYNYVSSLCTLLGYSILPWRWSSFKIRDDLMPITEMWMVDLRCGYDNTNINNCSFRKGSDYPYSDSYFRCEAAELLNGITPNTGIIKAEIFRQRQFICSPSDFNVAAANVTCNVLGHQRVGSVSAVNLTPDTVGGVFSGSIQCNGTEQSLELCKIEEEQAECKASSVVYIECFDSPMDIIPIGNKTNEGVVTLVYFGQLWLIKGSVSSTTAKTLCHLLGHGFEGTVEFVGQLPEHVFPPEYLTFSRIECNGNETDIAQCLKLVPYSVSCGWRCPPRGIPSGSVFVILYCDECPPGYFGTHCTECNCNNRSIGPCDVDTGECTCMTGWVGASCEVDIDECVETITKCPRNSNCTNVPGSYQCICRPGYIMTDYVCRIVQYEEEAAPQSNLLVIILSSVIGGFTLISIITIYCLCKYRMKGKKDNSASVDATQTYRPGNVYTLSGTNKSEDYSSIEDGSLDKVPVMSSTESRTDPYDTLDDTLSQADNKNRNGQGRPELPRRRDLNQVDVNKIDVNQIASTKDYDYTYPRTLPKDNDGYLKVHEIGTIPPNTSNQPVKPRNRPERANQMANRKDYGDTVTRTLPKDDDGYLKAHDVGPLPSDTNYQPPKPRNRPEHEYYKMKH